MKIKKTMTDRAISANRENAQKSTGPRRTGVVSQNAVVHGLLSKRLKFESEEDRSEFARLLHELEEDRQPVGPVERMLVEEAAVCIWKLQIANGLEARAVENQEAASRALMQTVADSHQYQAVPLFTQWNGQASDARLGWQCQELLVRSAKRDVEEQHDGNRNDRKSNTGRVEIEARLTTSLESASRYQASIKRDLYRVLSALREIQRDRKGGS